MTAALQRTGKRSSPIRNDARAERDVSGQQGFKTARTRLSTDNRWTADEGIGPPSNNRAGLDAA